ncbi:branched-chain amino acid ABC transporter permease [Lichenibacterium dinghuense]|uniref:branched-chain amino acid ABC transporter permease n=1 Tax=Lichenibacterium dinghuense TaxID=2895977 RepID=UPI001F23FDDF|nr:branched-chain amino acid ABC transporter permease [Lichenibacterium sp. 6Y81]
MSRVNVIQGVALLLGTAALATLPLWLADSYYVNIATQILFYAVFALALNVLVGYAGLTSLGHAALFGVSGYTAGLLLASGQGQLASVLAALVVTVLMSALFAVLSLRATGIGFLMITLALGQILWGLTYRWASLTNGDNGVTVADRPSPLGLSLADPSAFYWLTLLAFLVCAASMVLFVRSPFGASLRGTRDQPRRMSALGFDVWTIRFLAFTLSGFWSAVAGLLFVYYNQFISPQVMSLQSSAEVLLMVISGGTATLAGPVVGAALVVIMKNVVSAYVERWNMVLGIVFVLIISFMPEGLVPGTARLVRSAYRGLCGPGKAEVPASEGASEQPRELRVRAEAGR